MRGMCVCVWCAVNCLAGGGGGGVEKKTKQRRRSSLLSAGSSELTLTTCMYDGAPRLTERQQLALLLQMTAEKRGLPANYLYAVG